MSHSVPFSSNIDVNDRTPVRNSSIESVNENDIAKGASQFFSPVVKASNLHDRVEKHAPFGGQGMTEYNDQNPYNFN